MKSLNSKIIATLLVLTFVFSPIFTNKAEAQWVTWDPGNFVPNWGSFIKDMGFDAVAWTIVNLIIERMAAQTVNWINSGFDGAPAFVTDTGGFFTNLGDQIAGQYIFTNPNLNFLCGPISARIRLSLAQNYIQDNVRWQCTLSDVVSNVDAFINDFGQGGWDGFFELTQRQQNNPIGAFMQAENELSWRIANRQKVLSDELNWGRGFLTFKTCEKGPPKVVGDGGVPNPDGSINTITIPGDCIPGTEQNTTPGAVIEDQLNKTLGIGNNRLTVADEINEIVSSLLNQLTLKVVGGIGQGLRSLSGPGGANQSQSFTDMMLASTATSSTDYFGNQQNTDVLNTEPNLNQPIDGRTPVFPDNPIDSGNTCNPLTNPNCP